MSIESDMRERHGRVLAELAETGMVMVRRLSEAMLRTDDVQTQAQLGLAYHRVSRAVRQTMALEFRLSQEPRDIAPARPTPPPEPRPAAPPRLRAERVGWDEYERDDSSEVFDELDALLDAEDLDLDAAHEAVETCIAHIRRDLDAEPIQAHALEAAPAHADRPLPTPNGRRSQLLGGAASASAVIAPPRPPAPAWRSSA